jgi:hypothetical protein
MQAHHTASRGGSATESRRIMSGSASLSESSARTVPTGALAGLSSGVWSLALATASNRAAGCAGIFFRPSKRSVILGLS